MIEARVNGINIRPDDYNDEIHRDNLCCPDPNCNAKVHYVRESESIDGGQNSRCAHFASDNVKDHVKGCEVKKYEAACHKAITSIENGGFVIFNLNITPNGKTTKFNEAARGILVPGKIECKSDWIKSNKDLYKPLPIKHTGDLLPILSRIEEEHGEKGLNRCFFNSGGFLLPYKEFDLRGKPEELEKIYKSLVRSSRNLEEDKGITISRVPNTSWVFAAHRLISLKDLRHAGRNLQAAPQTINTLWGDRTLIPVIKPKSLDQTLTRTNLLNERDTIIISQPHLNIDDEKKALQNNTPSKLGLSLHSDKQFVISTEKDSNVKPMPTEQLSFPSIAIS